MKILLFGDTSGISQLLRHLPHDVLSGLVGASIRPQYIEDLQALARSLRIPFLLQPKWKSNGYDAFIDEIRALLPDLIWINSYSMILRPDVLAIPTKGVLNIHGALLPNNRGSNPTQWAIINRQYQTGVTLHEVDSGLDSGPIIDQISVPIGIADTWVDIRYALVAATEHLIQTNLDQVLNCNWKATMQIEALATFGPRRKEEDGFFSWSEPIIDIYNKIRALLPPIPSAFYVDERGVKRPIQEYKTLWQITTGKYKRNLLSKSTVNNRDQLRPFESWGNVAKWMNEFENCSQNEMAFNQLKKVIHSPDFVPFEVYTSRVGDLIGLVFLSKLDFKDKTMQAHLILGNPRMLDQVEVNRIRLNITDFVKQEYGAEVIILGLGVVKARA